MSRRRNEMFSFRLDQDEFQAFQRAANERGQSISQYVRDAAIAALTAQTGTRCIACGSADDVAWVVITGRDTPTITCSPGPQSATGDHRWAGWRCRTCCLRDYGFFGFFGVVTAA
jgi:hypothetical protein